jgi:hypothetical protein
MHIDIQYLPSLEYCAVIFAESQIEFEVYEHFPKQTYRNRSYILGANYSRRFWKATYEGCSNRLFTRLDSKT